MPSPKRPTALKRRPTPKPPYSVKRFLRDVAEVVIPAILLFLLINTFFIESRFVPTPSMVPTIGTRDWFLSNKTAYWFQLPQRGQIIVFAPPQRLHMKEDFVKRIIGLPGETIQVTKGVVYIDGKALAEPYITADRAPIQDFGPYRVPEGQLFMMGDNRNNSADSREWGPLPLENIKGRAWWRYWPLERMGIVE
jgi:signal peptidase I